VIGRGGYDNYLIYYCRSRGIPVIDLTEAVMAIHQNHDYAHHPTGEDGVFSGSEAQLNYQVDKIFHFTPVDADFRMIGGKLKRNYARGNIYWYLWSLKFLCRKEWRPLISIGLLSLRAARGFLNMLRGYVFWRDDKRPGAPV
jgi:hypothetical protein